jgi:hypothetical protein
MLFFRILTFNFLRSVFMRFRFFLFAFILTPVHFIAQPNILLRSIDGNPTCRVTKLGNPILLKDEAMAEVKLSSSIQTIKLPELGYYFVTIANNSFGFQAFEDDSLQIDWMGKEQRFVIRNGNAKTLNDHVAEVDSLCDLRLLAFLKLPAIRRSKEVKYFADTLRKSCSNYNSEWFRNYVYYRTAYVEIVAESAPRAELMKKYFERQAEPGNPAWIESFRNLYNGFLIQKINGRNGQNLVGALREQAWTKVWNLYRNDSLSMHPELREFAFILGISQIRSQNNLLGFSIDWALDSLASNSSFSNVKLCASVLQAEWAKYAKGADVNDFSFITVTGNSMRFSDLRGKPVYVCYYPSFSQSTYREIAMLQAFNERYKNEIVFLVVIKNTDRNGLIKALEVLKSTLLVAEFASCGVEFSKLPEDINSPCYFLINKMGKIYKAPAEGPETGVEESFLGLVKD